MRSAWLWVALALVAPATVDAQGRAKIFIRIDAIKGEATDDRYKDWIDVLGFGWGEGQQGAEQVRVAAAGAGGVARVAMLPLKIAKRVDRASADLFLSGAAGKALRRAELVVVRPGAAPGVLFLRIELEEVMVTSYQIVGSATAEGPPTEEVLLSFRKIGIEYTPLGPDGRPAGTIKQGWDLSKNVSWALPAP